MPNAPAPDVAMLLIIGDSDVAANAAIAGAARPTIGGRASAGAPVTTIRTSPADAAGATGRCRRNAA